MHEDDFVDWRGKPRPPMTAQFLGAVHIERARAATAEAVKDKVGRESIFWDEAQVGLAAARTLAAEEDIELPETTITVIEAQVELGRGEPGRSAALLRGVESDLGASTELAELENTLGRALLGAHDTEGIEHLKSAYRIALEVDDRGAAIDSVLALLEWYSEIADSSAALDVITQAYADRVVESDNAQFVLAEGLNLAVMGMAAQTSHTIARVRDTLPPSRRASALLIQAWANMRCDDHEEAIRVSDQAWAQIHSDGQDEALTASDQAVSEGFDSYLTVDDAGLPLVIDGIVYGETLRMTECTGYLLAAAARARELRAHDAASLYSAVAADYLLGYAGDIEGARQCLDEAERSPAAPGSEGWLRTQLVAASLSSRLGGRADAAYVIDRVIATLEQIGYQPSLLGLALMRGLAFDGLNQVELVAKLERTVPEVPVLARPLLLEGLRYVPVVTVDATVRDRLIALLYDEVVADPAYAGFTTFERAAIQWSWAETLRILGRPDKARAHLDAALTARGRDMYAWWRWLDAMSRLGPGAPEEPAPPPEERETRRDELSALCHILLAERRMDFDPFEVTQVRLRTAAACLADRAGLDHWAGRRSMAQAELDKRRADEEGALRSAVEAATSYSRLGDASLFASVGESYAALEGAAEVRDPDTVEVRFELPSPGEARLTLTRGDATSDAWRTSTARFGDVTDSDRSLTRLREALGPLTGGWRHWSAEVAEVIMPPELRSNLARATAASQDVCLRFDVRDLAALPWELTRLGGATGQAPLVRAALPGVVYRTVPSPGGASHQTRALQRCLGAANAYAGLVDGILGPMTHEAVLAFQHSADLPATGHADRATWSVLRQRLLSTKPNQRPLRATLLQIGARRELGRQRGYAAFGADPATAYAAWDWDVEVWEDIDVAALTSSPSPTESRLDLVHVVAPIRLSGGSTILDLAGDATERSYSPRAALTSVLSVTGLSDLLTWLGGGEAIPIVLLDMPLPQSQLELVRCLALRNSFAYQLLRLGRAETVLCTGLAEPSAQVEILEHVVGGLANGLDVAQVAGHLQGRWDPEDDLASAVAFGATALYLDRPPFTYLPPG